MIDLHAHVLPGLDDGAVDGETALRMLRIAVDDGITTLVATPHHNSVWTPSAVQIRKSVELLRSSAEEEGIEIELLAGQEVRVDYGLVEKFKAGDLLFYDPNEKYVLLEMPGNWIPPFMDQLIFELQMADITPVIAHPERNASVINDPEKLYDLIIKGCLAQLTSGSLTGRFGTRIQEVSETILMNDMVHVVSTDAHDDIDRMPRLSSAREVVQALRGEAAATALFETNPRHIIEGTEISAPEPKIVDIREDRPNFFNSLKRFLE